MARERVLIRTMEEERQNAENTKRHLQEVTHLGYYIGSISRKFHVGHAIETSNELCSR